MKKYIIRDPQQLDVDFYKGFHESFIYNKAFTLWQVIEKQDKFFELAEMKTENGAELKKYIEGLNAEIYFSELHQAEALFALLFAPLQDLPHWLYLTTYSTKEIKEGVEDFIKGGAKRIMSERIKTLKDFLCLSIYSNFMPSDKEKADRWDLNIDNIIWLLKKIGGKYLEANEYNAYKHGLRISTGETAFVIFPDNAPEQKTCLGHSKNSLTYLELKDKKKDGLAVVKTTKHFNPLENLNYLAAMCHILETIKLTRLARLLKSKEKVKINLFSEIDRNELLQFSKKFVFSMSV